MRRTKQIHEQPLLFDEEELKIASGDSTTDYIPIHVNRSTFKAGLSASVHRWFRLTPSFGPDLVRYLLEEMKAKKNEVVLDPFAGASTTLIESRLEGFNVVGYEINPLLHFVGDTSLNWSMGYEQLQNGLSELDKKFHVLKREHKKSSSADLPFHLPTIFNVERWWRSDVLKDLVLLREAIDATQADSGARNFFRLCLAGVLVPDLTNVTLGRLQLHFIDRAKDEIDVWKTYESHAKTMLADYEGLKSIESPPSAKLFFGDSVAFDPKPSGYKFDVVITSPPYPNRYSYVWNTRPHLYMLDIFKGKKEASDLDIRTIGGTWGTATSILNKGVIEPENEAVAKVIVPITEKIRPSDNLMANYCLKYFNMLASHLENLRPHLSKEARLAYVVGCSRLKGIYVETDELLRMMANEMDIGLSSSRVVRFRRRNSGKDLHESVVFMEAE